MAVLLTKFSEAVVSLCYLLEHPGAPVAYRRIRNDTRFNKEPLYFGLVDIPSCDKRNIALIDGNRRYW